MNTSDPDLPNFVRPEAVEVSPKLGLISDILAGTQRMWDQSAAKKYIRKWKDEKQEVYDIRRVCETLFEGFQRTLSAAVGMLFAKAPELTWNQSETAMGEHWNNLDAVGTKGTVLAKRFADKAIQDGLAIILVDHPPVPEGKMITAADEVALGLRPRWAIYNRACAINWYTDTVNNRSTLTRLVLEERGTRKAGKFGVESFQRYRVLSLDPGPAGDYVATWQLWEATKEAGMGGFKDAGKGTFMNRAGQPANRLPVAVAYTGRTDAPMCASIPLMGVAWANLAHWQISTDLRFGRMVAGIEQPVITGELMSEPGPTGPVAGKIKLGWMTAVHVGPGGSFDWKGPSGTGLDQLVAGVEEKLKQIGQMGLSFLVSDTRAAETAEAKRLDATAENSTLATASQGIEDALNEALEIHAWYMGIEKVDAPTISISREFQDTSMASDMLTAYVGAISNAGLPLEVLVRAMKKGNLLSNEDEVDDIVAQAMVNQAAKDAQREADRAMQAAKLGNTA